MKRHVAFFPVVLLTVVFAGLLPAQNNPAVGTWKLNVGKSKSSAAPLPKTATRTVEAQGDGLKTSYEEAEADGSQIKYEFTANYDGKDYPISGSGRPTWRDDMLSGAETIALRRVSSNAYAGMLKKADKVVMTSRTVVSKDGKVTTVTASGADAKGQPTTVVSVWDKQ